MKTPLIITLSLTLIIVGFSFQSRKNKMNKQQEETPKVIVDIWSDVVCPFCYVGKRKMEKAIAELNATAQVQINWHSFQLDPNFPKGQSMSTTEYLVKRKGYPKDQVVIMQKQVADLGKEYGINFQFEQAKSFNTGDVHRLIHWAKKEDKANELKEKLMHTYFTNGVDLNDVNNILTLVAEIGLDTSKARSVLQGTEYQTEVENDIRKGREIGITGVPYFLINGKQSISGAQRDEVFIKALSSALQNSTGKNETDSQGVCIPNGECK